MGTPSIASDQAFKEPIVNVMLTGGRVTESFRSALFDAAGRAGISVNEYVLTAAGEKLKAAGADFPGIFHAGDLDPQNDNHSTKARRRA